MKHSDLNKEDRKFLENLALLKNTDRIGYLSVVCMIVRSTPLAESSPTWSMLKNTSKNDFKRAIRCMRSMESDYPHRETIDSTIDYIRNEWLHKEVTA